ncbi:hypothetical protein FF2_039356 [Malus domestica]
MIDRPLRRSLVTTAPDDRACGGAYPPPLASRGFLSRTPFSLSRILSRTPTIGLRTFLLMFCIEPVIGLFIDLDGRTKRLSLVLSCSELNFLLTCTRQNL